MFGGTTSRTGDHKGQLLMVRSNDNSLDVSAGLPGAADPAKTFSEHAAAIR